MPLIFHPNDIAFIPPSIISMSIQTGIHKRLLQYHFYNFDIPSRHLDDNVHSA